MDKTELISSVNSLRAFEILLDECASLNKLLLLDFYADWCGPCRAAAPYFYQIAEDFYARCVVCAKVNADYAKDLCHREFVSALPTFKLYRNKECIITVVGARMEQLRSVLEKYAMDPSIVQIIATGDSAVRRSATRILTRIFRDVVQNPLKENYRRLKLSDPDFQTCLLNVPGAMECLFSAGYQEAEDCLILPMEEDLGRMKIMMEYLSSLCEESPNKSAAGADSLSSTKTLIKSLSLTPVQRLQSASEFLNWSQLLRRLSVPIYTVSAYMEPHAREQARSLIPTEELMQAAALKSGGTAESVSPRAFLRELLRWFKEEFFRWADSFECAECKTKMQPAGMASPLPEEVSGRPGTVELYRCPVSSTHPVYRFPRYNDVQTLLRTRLGRCGEWANCLTFLLSVCTRPSKGCNTDSHTPWFPACRYISDWTDHVWCEVWLEDEDNKGNFRWVHCDPGGELDQPLLYEDGWGKKLTYIFAYTLPPLAVCGHYSAKEIRRLVDVQDVTWRYTRRFAEVAARRSRALEPHLAEHLAMLHVEVSNQWRLLSQSLPNVFDSRHPYSLECIGREITSFLNPPKPPTEKLPGRQTGSLEWRRARGELGSGEPTWRGSNLPLRPSPNELKHGTFFLRYNAALDIYQRPRSIEQPLPEPACRRSSVVVDSGELISEAKKYGLKGWHALATRWRNISRKVEHDWHMVYLAREEGSAAEHDGRIEWVLDLHGTGYTVGKVSLFASMVCHASDSRAQFTLCSTPLPEIENTHSEQNGVCARLVPGSNALFNITDFVGSKFLRLEGRLWSESEQDCSTGLAWQQAQLFRQKDTDYVLWPFEWNVELIREDSNE